MIDQTQSCGAPEARQPVCIIVLAHNEEERIGACLASLPCGEPGYAVHVVVNGTTDRTAAIARETPGVIVHDWEQGGKSRSWNRIMFDTPAMQGRAYVFVDGDAVVLPGSIEIMVDALALRGTNAASAMPANGRQASTYQRSIVAEHGMFGDLYALSGSFVERMRAGGVRLPEDLIGDDSLVGALAKTDLQHEDHWDDERVVPCPGARFLCDPVTLSASGLKMQYARMRNYSLRHFQNRIVSAIMRSTGPAGLPPQMASLYEEYLPLLKPRLDPRYWWFDRQALARMQALAAALPRSRQSGAAKAA
ncbi:glycosyltransferase family A protein [Parerythrobacter aestuarii]|uniref:glycosyltransferase family A protein n=1 Tax=Parerythrobacter aestuarii TaxID=3020909 RepID=UPI0024DE8802|nr:glycosyltransferase family A protein [Parerythrobacter aestuarii]